MAFVPALACKELEEVGGDVKVAQELLRHANSRITMDLYTRAVSAEKRNASGLRMDLLQEAEKLMCARYRLTDLGELVAEVCLNEILS